MEKIVMNKKSPFTQVQELQLSTTTIPSNYQRVKNFHIGDELELEILNVVSAVGLISLKTLENYYGLTKNKIIYMEKSNKLVSHKIVSKSFKIPFYTLGENGSIMLGQPYVLNYWRTYRPADVLKRLLFIKLYERMRSTGHIIKIVPTMPLSPYTASFEYKNGDKVNVYVAKKSIDDLITHYKWAKDKERQSRLLLVLESFEQLNEQERYFKEIPMRAVLESSLFENEQTTKPLSYYLLNSELEFVED